MIRGPGSEPRIDAIANHRVRGAPRLWTVVNPASSVSHAFSAVKAAVTAGDSLLPAPPGFRFVVEAVVPAQVDVRVNPTRSDGKSTKVVDAAGGGIASDRSNSSGSRHSRP